MNTSRVFIEVDINGVNVTGALEDDTVSLAYNDNAGEESDDISLSIQNRDGRYMGDWTPTEGDTIRARILTRNWTGVLDCGDFIIDEPQFSGWPLVMTIGAQANPMNEEFSDIKKNKTWEQVSIRKAARDVADQDGVPLDYQAEFDISIPFLSQAEKSDKVFLHELCQKYGLTMKLYSNKIVIFDPKAQERQGAAFTLSPADLTNFSCKGSIANTSYAGCTARYYTKDGETLEYTATAKSKTDKIYRHDTVVDNLAEAQRVAESVLYKKNLPQMTFSGSLAGRTDLVSGICFLLEGFGKFDGKYFIDKAGHFVGGGYTVSIESHMVL